MKRKKWAGVRECRSVVKKPAEFGVTETDAGSFDFVRLGLASLRMTAQRDWPTSLLLLVVLIVDGVADGNLH